MKHADYPHEPGMLPGCRACEGRCWCGDEPDETCTWLGHEAGARSRHLMGVVCAHVSSAALARLALDDVETTLTTDAVPGVLSCLRCVAADQGVFFPASLTLTLPLGGEPVCHVALGSTPLVRDATTGAFVRDPVPDDASSLTGPTV